MFSIVTNISRSNTNKIKIVISKKYTNKVNHFRNIQHFIELIVFLLSVMIGDMNLLECIRVVDQINEKILRIPEWKNEVKTVLKSTNLFINGLVEIILLFAEYEKYDTTNNTRDEIQYNYCVFGVQVGVRVYEVDNNIMFERSDFKGLFMIGNILEYNVHGSLSRVADFVITATNVLTLFLKFHQYELENRFFNFRKWNNCYNLLDCDYYFEKNTQIK